MKENKVLLLTIVAVATLLVAIVGATFAYFAATASELANSSVVVNTSTMDSLVYTSGDPIEFTASQANFYKDAGNLSGETTSTVKLIANNKESATYCYTVDLKVDTNTFVYTVDSLTPELRFSISKDTAGAGALDIVVDRDVTTFTGTLKIPVASGTTEYIHTISADASGTTTDVFEASVSMINLETLQSDNEGKTFSGQLIFTTVDCQ